MYYLQYGRWSLGKFIPDRRKVRKIVAVGDMTMPMVHDYIVGNMYISRIFNCYTISQQFLVSKTSRKMLSVNNHLIFSISVVSCS